MTEVLNNESEHQFEVHVDGHLARLIYRLEGDRLVLVHTDVPDELEGRGIGGMLVTAAIEHARQHGLTVVPRCPFSRRWLERHPEIAAQARIDWPEMHNG